jgi:nitroreductase
MDVFEAVNTLLAVRNYKNTPLPADVVRRVVEAGRLSPSGMNAQPWHFVVVQQPDTLKRLAEVATTGPYLADAAAAIVVAIDDGKNTIHIADAARAIHSMALTAWDAGVGTNWVGFGGLDRANDIVGLPKEKTVIGIVPLGYPAQAVGRGKKKRKPLSEVASLERYGEPYS